MSENTKELGVDAQKCWKPTNMSLDIDGVPLKHKFVEKGYAMGIPESGQWKDYSGYYDRIKNPELGDWKWYFRVHFHVFDGEKWIEKAMSIQDIKGEDLIAMSRGEWEQEFLFQMQIIHNYR